MRNSENVIPAWQPKFITCLKVVRIVDFSGGGILTSGSQEPGYSALPGRQWFNMRTQRCGMQQGSCPAGPGITWTTSTGSRLDRLQSRGNSGLYPVMLMESVIPGIK